MAKDEIFLNFFEDPGHGWLEVPVEWLDTLGIQGEITGYSYLGNSADGHPCAYLEEDCDYSTFDAAAKSYGLIVNVHRVYQHTTPIRGYKRYSA